MNFRKKITVLEQKPGHYEKGHWQQGEKIEKTILASCQPMKASELENLPEGKRTSGNVVKIYTSSKLNVTNEKNSREGDIVLWQNKTYEIIGEDEYQMGVVPHYKYYAAQCQ